MIRRLRSIALAGTVVFAGCASDGLKQDPQGGEFTCLADSARNLELDSGDLPTCGQDSTECRDACLSGDASSCLSRAYTVQTDSATEGEAILLFHHACVLGSAIGCTNYAASLWASDPDAIRLACARKIFEMTCAAKEPWGCGMVGRLLLEHSERPESVSAGKAKLEESCSALGGFPCRVLAKHLEAGTLGPHPPGRIQELLRLACDGGDSDACGDPATAAETFH